MEEPRLEECRHRVFYLSFWEAFPAFLRFSRGGGLGGRSAVLKPLDQESAALKAGRKRLDS